MHFFFHLLTLCGTTFQNNNSAFLKDINGVPNTKNAGHKVAIVGESCNVDAYAKIPALFITVQLSR